MGMKLRARRNWCRGWERHGSRTRAEIVRCTRIPPVTRSASARAVPVSEEERALRGLLGGINFHCFGSPRTLAAFYAELLDTQEVIEHEWGEVVLIAKDRTRSDLGFHGGAKGRQPAWLDPERPPQIHLDIEVDDLPAAENLVARLGATRLPDMGAECVVYADLEGHPFCLYTTS